MKEITKSKFLENINNLSDISSLIFILKSQNQSNNSSQNIIRIERDFALFYENIIHELYSFLNADSKNINLDLNRLDSVINILNSLGLEHSELLLEIKERLAKLRNFISIAEEYCSNGNFSNKELSDIKGHIFAMKCDLYY